MLILAKVDIRARYFTRIKPWIFHNNKGVNQKDIIVPSMCTVNLKTSKYIKQILIE